VYFCAMLSVRNVKTKSGAIAVQVVKYLGHQVKVLKHVGSAKNDDEKSVLREKAIKWIENESGQTTLFPEQKQKILIVDRGECISVTHHFAWRFFICCAKECGLGNMPALLLDFAIMRLIEPASKIRTINLLEHYFDIKYSERIYRNIPKLLVHKGTVEKCAVELATEKFKEPFYFVLYDVTTLYFETFKEDNIKEPGFSKDNKPQQPQIVIGLLVTQSGFPLAYEVFSGSTFEGKTMLPIVKKFMNENKNTQPIIVADAAMLDEKRLKELQQNELSYIVGARLANTSLSLIKKIHGELKGENGAVSRFSSKHGYLVCDFSMKRFKKETIELNKQILKAEELVAKQSSGSKVKFVKKISKERVELNKALIEKRRLLLGIKGYCTNLYETKLSDEEVVKYYHQLWHIEQSFRMSKNDLKARPIYHRNEDPIRSHVLICFVALILEKYLVLSTGLSLRDIRFFVWDITESHIQDKLTKEVFVFRSPTKKILESPLGNLINKWNLLPH
jgi:hypothetical protein